MPMPTPDPHHEQEGTVSPESAPAGEQRGTRDAMRRQLEQHSALEDLGPLFGPKAWGGTTWQGWPWPGSPLSRPPVAAAVYRPALRRPRHIPAA